MTNYSLEIADAERYGTLIGELFKDWNIESTGEYESRVEPLYNQYGSGIKIVFKLVNLPENIRDTLREIYAKNYIGFYQASNKNDKAIMDYIQAFNNKFKEATDNKYIKFIMETRGLDGIQMPWSDELMLKNNEYMTLYLYDFTVN